MRPALLARLGQNKKRFFLLTMALLCLLASACLFFALQSVTGALSTQSAAKLWQGSSDQRFAQVSAFLPSDAALDEAGVFTLRQNLSKAMEDQSLQPPEGGSLFHDAYCGAATLAVSSERASMPSVKTLGLGGDWFFFHPLHLLGGSYIRQSDFMQDRVVLDEDLAWTLFGSYDVAGLTVQIGTRHYPVAGVVRREDDFATRAAVGEEPVGLFMSMEALTELSETPITCYEIVMPNPVSSYAKNTLTEKLAMPAAEVVENSGRFSFGSLLSVLCNLPGRTMNQKGIVYPYWENAARYCQTHAALLLFWLMVLLLPPLVLALLQIFHFGKRYLKQGADRLRTEIATRIEENKKKHYTREGI